MGIFKKGADYLTTITINVDDELRDQIDTLFASKGLDYTTGTVKMYRWMLQRQDLMNLDEQ